MPGAQVDESVADSRLRDLLPARAESAEICRPGDTYQCIARGPLRAAALLTALGSAREVAAREADCTAAESTHLRPYVSYEVRIPGAESMVVPDRCGPIEYEGRSYDLEDAARAVVTQVAEGPLTDDDLAAWKDYCLGTESPPEQTPADELVGLNEAAASKSATARGWRVYVQGRDGACQRRIISEPDFDRLNLLLRDGVVVAASRF